MTWRNRARTQDDLRRLEAYYRRVGYYNGLRGLPADSTNAVYQAAYRRGREERRKIEGGAA